MNFIRLFKGIPVTDTTPWSTARTGAFRLWYEAIERERLDYEEVDILAVKIRDQSSYPLFIYYRITGGFEVVQLLDTV